MTKKLTDETRKVVERTVARVQNYKQAFSTKQGKAVLLDLMQEHYILRPTYQGKEDEQGIAYREGQRNVVLKILMNMELDTSEMYLLIKQGDDDARK